MIAEMTTQARPPLSPTEERNLEAVASVLDYWNVQDIEGILSFYDDDIVWTNVAVEEVYEGKQQVREFLHRLITAFPDLKFDVVQKFASGDEVSERWYIRGTHNGPFMGIPPTGRYCEIAGISMVRMRDGKFLSDWFMIDVMGSLRQMGIMPSMKATQTPLMRSALWAAVHKNVVAGVAGAGVLGTLAVRRVRNRD
jgi:steroid delta-isomerase-like uncharacterized protein